MDIKNITKVCCDCKAEKPASEFHQQRDKRRPGLVHLRCRCKACHHIRKRNNAQKAGRMPIAEHLLRNTRSEPTEALLRRNALDAWRHWFGVMLTDEQRRAYCKIRNQSSNERSRLAFRRRYKSNPGAEIFRSKIRKSHIVRATPAWADINLIRCVYLEAGRQRVNGLDVHVDHVIPLKGRNVCGLHVHNNLEIIHAVANRAKRNHYSP